MQKAKIPFGIRNQALVSIESVRSGLGCNCKCPKCGDPLIARKGSRKVHHFAHYNQDCNQGFETALHLKAKAILVNSSYFVTPELPLFVSLGRQIPEKTIQIDSASYENFYTTQSGHFYPDVQLKSNGKPLLIEPFVTNPMSQDKINKVKNEKLPVIEIDLKSIYEHILNEYNHFYEKIFEELILSSSEFKYWVFNPLHEYLQTPTQKPLIWFETKDGRHLSYVEDCPLNKQTYGRGIKKGQSFAFFANCFRCDYNQLLYYPSEEQDSVFCHGHKQKLIEQKTEPIDYY